MTRAPAVLADALDGALVSALEAGALERWPGGWWAIPGCRVADGYRDARGRDLKIPLWSVGIGVVALLVRRGDLEITKTEGGIWTEVRPTEQARSNI